ncbi:MAG: hypothetical protein Greene071421_436 [Parcubacteria group bacterium Greene0714_21]|nr:MAG: hypothetical protein Greene041639_89 [Parcubacteria group bacterium Greene0416_39]TSC98201.1 MAG: hypothetical protein Greene101447_164 [Parcubacteria group bacterium Greene1014_47]TSD04070.1 MAG: hypothetical protein Greene071421_436 [Parcubacteria group bacterium Greene0714_21]
MKKSLLIGLLASVMFLSFASLVFALPTDIETLPEVTKATLFGDTGLINKAANLIFTGLLIVSTFFILIAAFQFVTGGGNAEALEKARAMLIWAVVGIAVAFLAKGLPTIIFGVLK